MVSAYTFHLRKRDKNIENENGIDNVRRCFAAPLLINYYTVTVAWPGAALAF
jgi:hypothetical protein